MKAGKWESLEVNQVDIIHTVEPSSIATTWDENFNQFPPILLPRIIILIVISATFSVLDYRFSCFNIETLFTTFIIIKLHSQQPGEEANFCVKLMFRVLHVFIWEQAATSLRSTTTERKLRTVVCLEEELPSFASPLSYHIHSSPPTPPPLSPTKVHTKEKLNVIYKQL